jgi:two-component system, chemotaxis family, sensor kinase CheA
MTRSLSHIQQELLAGFFEEAFEGIAKLESGLLSLHEPGQEGLVHDIFRAAHSMKGGAGSFGFSAVTEMAHVMETVLDAVRSGTLSPSSELSALLLEGVDALRVMLSGLRDDPDAPSPDHAELLRRLNEAAPNSPDGASTGSTGGATAVSLFHIHLEPPAEPLSTGTEPLRLLRELAGLGEMQVTADASRLPPLSELDPARVYFGWDIQLRTSAVADQIRELLAWIECPAEMRLETAAAAVGAGPAAVATAKSPLEQRAENAAELDSIRVGVDKIDLLMNMVGELVITQSMLGELDGEGPIDKHRFERLREGLSLLARNTRSLQESVMRLRSMPIGVVFNRFPRLVHDLGRKLGKAVELKISGQATELDKTVLERLGDPLVHLVRNSLDHGVESPEARLAAGKPERATIELKAYHRGGDIWLEVVDDGRGIDREKVLARAREAGLVSPDETPSDDVINELLFAPGFSTATTVTDVSGRGVGMDVVRRNVRSLGGEIILESTPGQGTRTLLRLPLTLAIVDGQLIRLGQHSYVIPLLSIVESVQVEPARVGRCQGGSEIYRLRDELIPIVDLGPVLGLPASERSLVDRLMVIVESEGERIGLLVDELLAQQQVVVKSLETNYGRVEELAGATILGDGGVAFILDSAGIGRSIKSRMPDRVARVA